MPNIVHVGIVGLGKLGQATLHSFFDNHELIQKKIGKDLKINLRRICDLNINKLDLKFLPDDVSRCSNCQEILDDPEIKIVVDLMDSLDDAEAFIEAALKLGKSVVTSNKVVLAKRAADFFELAEENNVCLGIEGAVLGGLPIVHAIRDGLVGDEIKSFYGIVNGATNFILTALEGRKGNFQELIKEAGRRGYLERDPNLDLDGLDSADKAVILALLCFGKKVELNDVYYEGIKRVRLGDFEFARQLGYTIRLIAMGSQDPKGQVTVSVAPTLVPLSNILASVKENYNALFINGEKAGETLYCSRVGTGEATSIGILADIINIARDCNYENCRRNAFLSNIKSAEMIPYEEMEFRFYIRFVVDDQPGILAAIDEILAWHKINIKSFINVRDISEFENTKEISFVMDVDPTRVKEIREAVSEMQGLKFFREEPFCMRIL